MRDQNVSCIEISGFKYVSVIANDKTPEELHETLVSKIKLVLSSGSDEECTVCLESLTLPVITHCAHVFCKACILKSSEMKRLVVLWLKVIVITIQKQGTAITRSYCSFKL